MSNLFKKLETILAVMVPIKKTTHSKKAYTLNAVSEASALPPLFRSEGTSDAMALYPGDPCHILYQQIVAILSWNRIAAWKDNHTV
jgi:hypothetical protein